MDALSELGQQPEGAEAVLLHPSHLIQDVASKALSRAPSPDVTLAAVHALATAAGATASLPGCLCILFPSFSVGDGQCENNNMHHSSSDVTDSRNSE